MTRVPGKRLPTELELYIAEKEKQKSHQDAARRQRALKTGERMLSEEEKYEMEKQLFLKRRL